MLLLVGAVVCLCSFAFDQQVVLIFDRLRGPFFKTIAEFLNHLGDWPAHTAIGLVGLMVTWSSKREHLTRIIVAMLIASTVAGLTANVLRAATGRPRPGVKIEDGFYGPKKDGRWIVLKNAYKSFPSAHTATASAFGAVALFAGLRRGWLLALFGPLVGCARIYSKAHHFSDVTSAVFLGFLFAGWAWGFMAKRKAATHPIFASAKLKAQPSSAMGMK